MDSGSIDQVLRFLDLHQREKRRNPDFFRVSVESVTRWHTEKLKVGSMGDRLLSFNLNMLADARCRRGEACYDPTCIFLHRSDVIEEAKAVEGVVYVLLSEAMEAGLLTRDQRRTIAARVVSGTSPKSRQNRIRELACLIHLHTFEDWRDLASYGLLNIAMSGADLALDTFSFDAESLAEEEDARRAIIDQAEVRKILSRLGELDPGFRLLEVTSDKRTGIGQKSQEVLYSEVTKLYPAAVTEGGKLTFYHLLLLLKARTRAELAATLHSCAKTIGWTEELVSTNVEVVTLKALHAGSSLVPLLPPSKFDLEKEVVIAEKRLAKVFQELVSTRESREEGGLRSCLRPLSEAESLRGHHATSLALTLLHQMSNMLAHQGLTNLALYLALLSRVVRRLKADPALMVYHEKDRLEPLGRDREAHLRKEADTILAKIDRQLGWDFPALATVASPKVSAGTSSPPASSPPGTPPPTSSDENLWKGLGEGVAKVTIS